MVINKNEKLQQYSDTKTACFISFQLEFIIIILALFIVEKKVSTL
jgi:hypothetical protein